MQNEAFATSTPVDVVANHWGWRHGLRKNWAVKSLDLRIEPGEKILLLGPSGAGKSTLLHALAGVLDLEQGDAEGQLLVAGKAPGQVRGSVGMVLQDPENQIVLAKIGDEVAFGCENLGIERAEIWRRVRWALAQVGLDLPLTHPTHALSGGQKQRLALAAALAMKPGLLLLDEPTANLDPEGVTEVRDAVLAAQAATGASMIVVEHRVEIWAEHVDRIIVLEPGGGVRASGKPATVLAAHGERLATEGVWVADFVRPEPAEPATRGEMILGCEKLTIGYSPRHPIQQNIDLELFAGESTCIIGPNGAGKSTLAKTLAGLLTPLDGRVVAAQSLRESLELDPKIRSSWFSRPRRSRLDADPHKWASRHLLQRIGTVFQSPEHQFLASTVRQELELGPRALGLEEAEISERVERLLGRLRLDKLAGANPFTLSGGEKRRLSVATVLATAPRIIFLDEPTFGQDLRTWRELITLLKGLQEAGTTIISVTHDQDYITAMGQRIITVNSEGVSG